MLILTSNRTYRSQLPSYYFVFRMELFTLSHNKHWPRARQNIGENRRNEFRILDNKIQVPLLKKKELFHRHSGRRVTRYHWANNFKWLQRHAKFDVQISGDQRHASLLEQKRNKNNCEKDSLPCRWVPIIIISEWMRCNRRSSLRKELLHWPSFSPTKKNVHSIFCCFYVLLLVMPESARVLLSGVGMNDFPVVFYAPHTTHRIYDSRARYINVKDRTRRKYGQRAMVRTSSLKLFYFFSCSSHH